jgi:hypothetical protein
LVVDSCFFVSSIGKKSTRDSEMEREDTCAEKGEGEGSKYEPQYHMHFTGLLQAAAAAAAAAEEEEEEEEEDRVSESVLKP